MLRVALYTPNPVAAQAIEQLAQESGVFELIVKGSPIPSMNEVMRTLATQNPELILLDIGQWSTACEVADQIAQSSLSGVVIGFRAGWNRLEQLAFEEAGIRELLHDPFSLAELEAAAYEGLHRRNPITNPNILAFLPAKAGSGCSTVVLNTAAALANGLSKKVLLAECDRRSGVFSILLNLDNPHGLAQALENASKLTDMDWHKHVVKASSVDLLLANPTRRGPLPSWAHYYKLLQFVQSRYDFILADLPEVINRATAEVVRCARGVFVVCEPELPSLKLAELRCAELEECEIPAENVHIVLNRWESDRFSLTDVERILGRPVFAALPNDYRPVKDAAFQAQLVSDNSKFAKGCRAFARKLSDGMEAGQQRSKFKLLEKLGRLAS